MNDTIKTNTENRQVVKKVYSGEADDDLSVCSHQTESTQAASTEFALSGEKTVTFKNRPAKVYEVPYVCDIDDTDDYWYANEEYKFFKTRDKLLVAAMRSAVTVEKLEEEAGECTRGLEREAPEQKRRSHAQKRESWAIVLSQADPLKNADAIAKAYGRCTRSSARDATIIARVDAIAAQEYAQDDSAMESSLPVCYCPRSLESKLNRISLKAELSSW